jgi:hypothetical protein
VASPTHLRPLPLQDPNPAILRALADPGFEIKDNFLVGPGLLRCLLGIRPDRQAIELCELRPHVAVRQRSASLPALAALADS